MIDILYVHANASDKIYQDLAENHAAIEPPIWAAMLANSARSQGYKVEILDAEADTSITADTDDQIDIKVANSDMFMLNAAGDFKILTDGSAIAFGANN